MVAAVLTAGLGPDAGAARADCADVALVLAIDASGSVDAGEFALQMDGYVRAFRHPSVLRAIERAGAVEIAAVVWGDSASATQILPWRQLGGAADAAELAQALALGFTAVGGNTGLGDGLWTALDLHDQPGRCALRAVVNVSGDGRASAAPKRWPRHSLIEARRRAARLDVTVNGLAILTEVPDLAAYYRDAVAVGPDAFVVAAASFEDFAEAVTRKLVREIAPPAVAALDEARRAPVERSRSAARDLVMGSAR